MRPFDSSYDRMTSERRAADPGACTYALITDHALAAAPEAAR